MSDKTEQYHQAMLNDTKLRGLESRRIEIYSMVVPVVHLKNGEVETTWLDSDNHPLLPDIEKQIELRKDELKKVFGIKTT